MQPSVSEMQRKSRKPPHPAVCQYAFALSGRRFGEIDVNRVDEILEKVGRA